MQYDPQLGGQIPSFNFACLFFTDIWRYFQTDYSVSNIIPGSISLLSPSLCSFIFQVLLHRRMILVGRVFLFRQRRRQEKPLKTNTHPTENSQTVLWNKLINRYIESWNELHVAMWSHMHGQISIWQNAFRRGNICQQDQKLTKMTLCSNYTDTHRIFKIVFPPNAFKPRSQGHSHLLHPPLNWLP